MCGTRSRLGGDASTPGWRRRCLCWPVRRCVDAAGHIGHPVRALAVAAGRTGVPALLAGGEIWLTEIPPSALVSAIVSVFPPGIPAPRATRSLWTHWPEPVPAAGRSEQTPGYDRPLWSPGSAPPWPNAGPHC
ncbi:MULTISPECIES: ESX secretion-associated protein EspG [Amycolatopsis]|uniref:ESX secretion-associated protein EspG n=1 Tax=Amycolatopsis TaxID=1813 RepID=UPI001F0765DD|nr:MULTISPECIES: ESX secretion-associated protein EspG [Amycolatopsis]